MKDVTMDIDWRTVQLFLDNTTMGVFEVQIDSENNRKVRCTCPAFNNSARCKHVKFVKNSMEQNDGHYSIKIPVEISDEEAFVAMSDSESFREFIIKYGTVEVI
jgi:hypothetical protein